MDRTYKTKEQLMLELDDMQRKLHELEFCKLEFEKAEKRYKKFLEAAPDGMVFINSDYEIVLINAQAERLFGYEHGELKGRKLDLLIPERLRTRHRQNVAEFFKNPRTRSMGSDLKIFALRKDGSEFRADISLSPLQTEDTLLVTAAVRDITERVEAQEIAERNFHIQRVISTVLKMALEPLSLETQLDRTLELILSVPHLSFRNTGAIYLVEGDPQNLALKAQRGMTDAQMGSCVKVSFGKCICGESISSCELLFNECADEKAEMKYQESFHHWHYCVPISAGNKALGLINVEVREGHIRNRIEEEFLLAIANTLAAIIERCRAEDEKQRLQKQLALSEKLAALGRIASNIAHEFRNPLTAVGGFARRLLSAMPAGTKENEYASFIVSEVMDLEKALNDVMDYSKVIVPHPEMHDMHAIIDEIMMLYEDAFRERNITAKTHYKYNSNILVDRQHAKDAIGNLVSNAVDAMPNGGPLDIVISRESIAEHPYLCVTVSDSGEGMPPQVVDKIFEPFYTTKVAKRGVGLGLPIAKKIAEEHGGFITVASTPGKGTSITLHFPQKKAAEKKENSPAVSG